MQFKNFEKAKISKIKISFLLYCKQVAVKRFEEIYKTRQTNRKIVPKFMS